jgi:hypothetical protein
MRAFSSFFSGAEVRCAGHERFDPTGWRDSVQAGFPLAVRGCMARNLLKTNDFHDRTRTELVELLGEPPKTSYFREYDLVYWLGPEPGPMGIDSEWLVFRLDSAQRVRDYRIVRD